MSIWLSPFEYLKRINLGIFLESGFLNIRSYGKCLGESYRPAVFHMDGNTASYTSGTDTPIQGSVNLLRKFWETEVEYRVDDEVTPYPLGDLDKIFVCKAAGLSGTSNPVWVFSSQGDLTVDGAMVWEFRPDLKTALVEEPFNGEALLEGSESRAVGCVVKRESVRDPCNNLWVNPADDPESEEDNWFCSGNILSIKETQAVVPSSMFTGKLRLYVQALYGSFREDYARSGFDLRVNEGSSDPKHPEYLLSRGFTGNSWLYTTANYDYFLCRFVGSQIQFIKLELSTEGRRFKDTLLLHTRNTDPVFATKVEAYILSTARVTNIGTTVNIVGPEIVGAPLDYGWHATWDGHKANVVCFYRDPGSPQYLSNQYEINIIEVWDGTSHTFTATNTVLLADEPWWPWTNGLNLIYYDETLQSMVPVEYPNTLLGGFTGGFDAPIYNRYIRDATTGVETLDTVNIFMDIDGASENSVFSLTSGTLLDLTATVIDARKVNVQSGSKGFTSSYSWDARLVVESSDIDNLVKYIPDAGPYNRGWPFDLGAYGDSNTHPTLDDWAAANGVTIGETSEKPWTNPDTGEVSTVTAVALWRATWARFLVDSKYSPSPSGKDGAAYFELALGDANAYIAGEELHSHSSEGVSHTIRGYVERTYKGSLDWVYNVEFWGKPTVEVIAGSPPDMSFRYNQFDSPDLLYPTEDGPEKAPPHDTTKFSLDSHYPSKHTEVSGVTAGNAEYFHPTASDKPTHTTDTARQSISGLNKINHADFTKDGGYLHDSAVGWV